VADGHEKRRDAGADDPVGREPSLGSGRPGDERVGLAAQLVALGERRAEVLGAAAQVAQRSPSAAVALARHYREFERLSIRQIADRLGRSPATVKAYFYDPTGEKAKAVKARCQGVCHGCGAYTQPRNGKGDAYAYCKACHPGAIQVRWTRQRALEAMREWRELHGRLPSSYDWSRTHAHRRGGAALDRLDKGGWPAASVVTDRFGTWAAAREAAMRQDAELLGSST
jgi:AraC-like DNA-binding protein